MRNVLKLCLLMVSLLSYTAALAQMPQPQEEHKWLKKFVGEWEFDAVAHPAPGHTMNFDGTETVRAIGDFWITSKGYSEFMGMKMDMQMTLGFDINKEKYVGTWVDSMTDYMWSYEGTVDESGKVLTLESFGPCPMKDGEMTKFKETTEFVSDDHRVFTSKMLDDDEWVTIAKIDFWRKGTRPEHKSPFED